MHLDDNFNPEDKEKISESALETRLVGSLRKEAIILGKALCISAIYLGMGVIVYRGCTDRYPWEEERDKGKVQENYTPASGSSIWEIPLP